MTHPLDHIAHVCHEVNRAYCQARGDNSQPAWEDAPAWQRESARMGVDLHLGGDFGPEASHESWTAQKVAEGWTYGPKKRPDLKQHPCMVPFDQLPREQQAKDYLFRAVVHALRPARVLTEADAPRAPLTDDEVLARGPAGITKHSYLRGWRDAEQALSLSPQLAVTRAQEPTGVKAARQPLTDELIAEIDRETDDIEVESNGAQEFARAIERACAEAWGVALMGAPE